MRVNVLILFTFVSALGFSNIDYSGRGTAFKRKEKVHIRKWQQ